MSPCPNRKENKKAKKIYLKKKKRIIGLSRKERRKIKKVQALPVQRQPVNRHPSELQLGLLHQI
jgi:hypothetical protein